MEVHGEPGVEWGMVTLVGDEETPLSNTDQYHFIFYVALGRANLTIGDGYDVPFTDVLLAEGFGAEVLRGNHYCFKNADAGLHATIFYY